MQRRFPANVENALRRSGWSPNRRVSWDLRSFPVELFPAAKSAIEEFGGLHVAALPRNQLVPGAVLASIDVHIDPTAEMQGYGSQKQYFVDLLEDLERFQAATGQRQFPLGQACDGYMSLFIDQRGSVFGFGHPTGELDLIGPTLDEALTVLLTGASLGGSAQTQHWQL